MLQTTTRAANLENLVDLLRDHHARRVDIVGGPGAGTKIDAAGGHLVVSGAEPILTDEGVDDANGVYLPTGICDSGLATKLGIDKRYLSKCRSVNTPLWDDNINGWLGHESFAEKKYLLRCLRGDDGTGVARAFLSDSFKPVDNLDVLMAVLAGVRAAGVEVDIPQGGCDLSDARMYVKIHAPQIQALAPKLLEGYRSPWGMTAERGRRLAAAEGLGYEPGTEPVVFAGLVITNSEVGRGAFQIAPQVVIRICKNGLTVTSEAMRAQHLGAKLEEGVIRWSSDTQEKSLALVTAQARDAVTTFLDPAYIGAKVAELEETSGTEVPDPQATITHVAKKLQFSEEHQNDILRHFMLGGQATAGGVMQAVTSVAQIVSDADEAARMEGTGIEAMQLAAAHAG